MTIIAVVILHLLGKKIRIMHCIWRRITGITIGIDTIGIYATVIYLFFKICNQ